MKQKIIGLLLLSIGLSGCLFSPEQQAMREAKRIKQAQALEVQLAKQCDANTAALIEQYYHPPLTQTAEQQQKFTQNYVEKVNNPLFQACYKLALENYKAQEEIRYMQQHYDDYFYHLRLCRSCWNN